MQKRDSMHWPLAVKRQVVALTRKLDWRRWPLTPKLAAGMTALVLLMVMSLIVLSVAREQAVFQSELQQQAELQLNTLEAAGADALYNLQASSLINIMQALSARQVVASGRFYDAEGRVVADANVT